jgi:hypothetical protein
MQARYTGAASLFAGVEAEGEGDGVPAVLDAVENPIDAGLEMDASVAFVNRPRLQDVGSGPDALAVDPEVGPVVAADRDPHVARLVELQLGVRVPDPALLLGVRLGLRLLDLGEQRRRRHLDPALRFRLRRFDGKLLILLFLFALDVGHLLPHLLHLGGTHFEFLAVDVADLLDDLR